MSIRFWIAGPVTVLGLIAVAVAAWLTWGPADGDVALDPGIDQGLAIAEHAAGLREAQRLASGLAVAALADSSAGGALRARLREALAATAWQFERMRGHGEGSPFAPMIARLGAETARWRDDVGRLLDDAQAGRRPDPAALATLAVHDRTISQLAGDAAHEIADFVGRTAAEREAAHRRAGALAIALLAGAILGVGGLALAFSHALVQDLQRVPRDLRALGEAGPAGWVAGETRNDELGIMVRSLREFAGTFKDLTQSRAEMRKMALTDPLTGLPNRRGLHDFLARISTHEGWADASSVAAMHVDIDHFKTINDTIGHEAGDAVLREAARRMALAIRDSDMLARLGGDEFVIFARGVESVTALEGLADRVVRQFDQPIVLGDSVRNLSVSVGAVLGGRRGRVFDPQRLLVSADIALCQAKSEGRNRFAVFSPAMARGVERQHELAAEIRAGIARGEFQVWFKPVIDVRTNRATALSIVPRWKHPERGLLTPGAFLAVAEAHGLTESMALPLFEKALRATAGWRDSGIAVPQLHMGLSRTMLLAPAIVDRLSWMIDESRWETEQITLQISEQHCAGRGVELFFENLRRFVALGFTVVVDDFGAVDAALGTVARIGATRIKVASREKGVPPGDVGSAGDGGAGRLGPEALARAYLRVGETFGIGVIAKGVDELADLHRLAALGFTEMQGAAVGPAMDLAATPRWLSVRLPALRLASG